MTKHIPNLFTLLNLFAGVLAIIFALQTETLFISQNDAMITSFNIPERLVWAGIAILAAAVIDFLDGFVARLLHATSELGKQLDSLSDVVSFGVAPAVILYQLLRLSYAREEDGLYVSMILLLPAVVLACATAYRLGKFNISDNQHNSFSGLPCPATGIFVASLPLILHSNYGIYINSLLINKWVLYAIIAVFSYLMVSNHTMLAFKFAQFRLKENWQVPVLAVVALLAALFLGWLTIPITILMYIILSFLSFKTKKYELSR